MFELDIPEYVPESVKESLAEMGKDGEMELLAVIQVVTDGITGREDAGIAREALMAGRDICARLIEDARKVAEVFHNAAYEIDDDPYQYIGCKCDNWETFPADMPRHKSQTFKWLGNTDFGTAFYECPKCNAVVESTIDIDVFLEEDEAPE